MNKVTRTGFIDQRSAELPGRVLHAGAKPGQDTQLTQIIQQVAELKTALHNFIDQEEYADAAMVSASGVLEGHLNHYYQMALEKSNQKPGLKTF